MKTFIDLKSLLIVCASVILLTSCSNIDIQKLNNRANELMSSGDVDGAISRLESINDLNPNFPQTHYNLGIAYHKKGEYEKAVTSLDNAVRLKNDFAEAYYTRGVVYEEIALSLVDKNKKNKTTGEKTIFSISDNFKKSQESYTQYVQLVKDSNDVEEVKSKIEALDADIKKYETMSGNNAGNY